MGDLSNDRNIAGKPGEASCKAMNMHFDTDDTWGRIGSNRCHAKVHLVANHIQALGLLKLRWHGSRSAFWNYEDVLRSNGNSNAIAMVGRICFLIEVPMRMLPLFTGHNNPRILDYLASSTSGRYTIRSVSAEAGSRRTGCIRPWWCGLDMQAIELEPELPGTSGSHLILPPLTGPLDRTTRFTSCRWWVGDYSPGQLELHNRRIRTSVPQLASSTRVDSTDHEVPESRLEPPDGLQLDKHRPCVLRGSSS